MLALATAFGCNAILDNPEYYLVQTGSQGGDGNMSSGGNRAGAFGSGGGRAGGSGAPGAGGTLGGTQGSSGGAGAPSGGTRPDAANGGGEAGAEFGISGKPGADGGAGGIVSGGSGGEPGAAGEGLGENTGGDASGGTNTGGTNTGGANTGGANTGGANTGGTNTGGKSTGGVSTGGTVSEPEPGPRTLGYVGASIGNNILQGYAAEGGDRLWPAASGYGGLFVQSWATNSGKAWDLWDTFVAMYGTPTDVFVVLECSNGAITYQETTQLLQNLRSRVPSGTIYITGFPQFEGAQCSIAGAMGTQLTNGFAEQASEDSAFGDIVYVGPFGPLTNAHRSDGCHANTAGMAVLGQQAIETFGE
jgi:hypothetical protein